MKRLFVAALLASMLGPVLLAVQVVGSQRGHIVVRFVDPVQDGYGWRVEAKVGGLSCSGVVAVNPGYLEARAISRHLVVLPLYYVLSSICGSSLKLINALDGLAQMPQVEVVIEAPSGYVVRSSMDWRGFGPPGGPYVVAGDVLRRFYLYDGVVVADGSRYRVIDSGGLSLVVYSGFSRISLEKLRAAIDAALGEATSVFGVSPRSPVVAVLAGPSEFALLAPSTAYSLGAVFLVVDSLAGRDEGWYVHVFAHESLHGWVNDGLVYGDFSFLEAVVEFLSVKGLYDYNRSLYRLAEHYIGEGVDSGEPYAVWMRAHALLWALGRSLCSGDPYADVLHEVFNESLGSSTPRIYSLVDVLRGIRARCGGRVAEAWGYLLPDVEQVNITALLSNPDSVAALAPGSGDAVVSKGAVPGGAPVVAESSAGVLVDSSNVTHVRTAVSTVAVANVGAGCPPLLFLLLLLVGLVVLMFLVLARR